MMAARNREGDDPGGNRRADIQLDIDLCLMTAAHALNLAPVRYRDQFARDGQVSNDNHLPPLTHQAEFAQIVSVACVYTLVARGERLLFTSDSPSAEGC